MASTTITNTPNPNRRALLATGFALAYVVVAVLALILVDRNSLWYPLYNVFAYSMYVLSPILIISLPIPNPIKFGGLAILLLVVTPMLGIYNNSYMEIAVQICIFAGLALGLNIVVGFAGLLDLGYVAFFAVGAYLWAVFTSTSETVFKINGWLVPGEMFWVFLVIGVFIAAFVGILLGLPVLRLRGDYLAIVTLGFGEVIRILARNANDPINITNGAQGLIGIGKPPVPDLLQGITNEAIRIMSLRVDNPSFVAQQLLFYLIAVGLLVLIIVISRRLEDSPIGRAWTAIREDEVAAKAMGVPLVRMKLAAFATGASFGGAIGVLYAAKQAFVDPTSFVLLQSIIILAMVIVGGMGSIRGVILGAIAMTLLNLHVLTNLSLQLNALRNVNFIVPIIDFPIRNWPNQLEPAKYQPLIFGLVLVLMMIFRPEGLMPAERRKLELKAEREESAGLDEQAAPQPKGDA